MNGNLTGDGTNTYTWNTRNQLTGISGSTTASFLCDALGRRESKTINGTATNFLYDGLNIEQELNGTTPTVNYLTGENIDETFSRTDSGGAESYLTDNLDSTLALTSSSGAISTSYSYEPYGNTTASGTSSTNALQYTGRENDGTGLYYFRARYYSPTYERFISSDQMGLIGGINTYAYVFGNPVNYADPLGLYCLSAAAINGIAGSASGALAGGAALAELGPVGILAGAFVGGVAGGAIGYFSSPALGNQVALGAVGGGAEGLNAPISGVVGGAVGGAASYGAQQLGAPDSVSGPIGSTIGGAAGGAVAPALDGIAGGAAAGAVEGGAIGAASGAVGAAVAAGLTAGNNCPCGRGP